jgi:hypothetical protein
MRVVSTASFQTGLARLGVVLAWLAAGFGGLLGYLAPSRQLSFGAEIQLLDSFLGGAIGFAVVWTLMRILRWIIAGFTMIANYSVMRFRPRRT